MGGIFEAYAGLFFAAVFVGADFIEHAIGVGDAGEGNRDGADDDRLGDGLELAMDSGEQAGSSFPYCIWFRPLGIGAIGLREDLLRKVHHRTWMRKIPPTTMPAKARKVRMEPMMAAPTRMRRRPMAAMRRRMNIQMPATQGAMSSQGLVPPGIRARRLGLMR